MTVACPNCDYPTSLQRHCENCGINGPIVTVPVVDIDTLCRAMWPEHWWWSEEQMRDRTYLPEYLDNVRREDRDKMRAFKARAVLEDTK